MFSALAGMVMAVKVHFNQMKYPIEKKGIGLVLIGEKPYVFSKSFEIPTL